LHAQGAVGQLGREGGVAAAQPGAPQRAGQLEVGVRPVLVDGPQDRVCRVARGICGPGALTGRLGRSLAGSSVPTGGTALATATGCATARGGSSAAPTALSVAVPAVTATLVPAAVAATSCISHRSAPRARDGRRAPSRRRP